MIQKKKGISIINANLGRDTTTICHYKGLDFLEGRAVLASAFEEFVSKGRL